MADVTLAELRAWDKQDPLRRHRAAFQLPRGIIYLDGNSLGPLPKATRSRLAATVGQAWGEGLIRSWESAGWMAAPARIGARIAGIVGAAPDEVIVADSTSVNLFKLAAAALGLRPGRGTILLEADAFPTDRHVAAGLARLLPGLTVRAVPPDELTAALTPDVAVALLCDVHYRTGARHDMTALTRAVQAAGALALWDVSHSVGAVPVDLAGAGADLAVGCGYKFLNGGPGAPAFLYVARRHQVAARPPVQGWIGHAAPFAFSDLYAPAAGVGRFLSGTPAVLGLAALEAGVEGWLAADRTEIWAKSARLFDLFASRAATLCPTLALATPTAPALRGSHIAFRCREAQAVMARLLAAGLIGDYRPPDILRFGLTPLYTRYEDIGQAVDILHATLAA